MRKLAATGTNRGEILQCGLLSGDRHLVSTSSRHILSCETHIRGERVHLSVPTAELVMVDRDNYYWSKDSDDREEMQASKATNLEVCQ
jgi:hypothetical protein